MKTEHKLYVETNNNWKIAVINSDEEHNVLYKDLGFFSIVLDTGFFNCTFENCCFSNIAIKFLEFKNCKFKNCEFDHAYLLEEDPMFELVVDNCKFKNCVAIGHKGADSELLKLMLDSTNNSKVCANTQASVDAVMQHNNVEC